MPANISAEMPTRTYRLASTTSEITAAIPGVFSLPVVSSYADSAVSHPQYMKIESDRAVTRAENVSSENGFSHEARIRSRSRLARLGEANTMNSTSATSWIDTSTYITLLVAVMPR